MSPPKTPPKKPVILVTAFSTTNDDPDCDNMSERTLAAIADTHPDATIVKCLLPVEYKAAFLQLQKALQTYKPTYTIMLGEGATSGSIMMEHHAHSHAQTPDNLNQTPADYHIPDPNREVSTLNPQLMRIVELASNKYLPEEPQTKHFDLSTTAGDYLCNNLFYNAISLQKNNGRTMFLHLGGSGAVPSLFQELPNDFDRLNQLTAEGLARDIHFMDKEENLQLTEELNSAKEKLCAEYEHDQASLPQKYAKVVHEVITNIARKPDILKQHVGFSYTSCSSEPAPAYVAPDYLGTLTPPRTADTPKSKTVASTTPPH